MIIHKDTKSVETSSNHQNDNFGNYENVFIVDDNSELGQKILENQLYFDFILDDDGNLIDIEQIEKPDIPEQPSELEILREQLTQANADLNGIKQTFNLIPPISNPSILEDYKQNKIYELKTECEQEILSGFYSSCRGIQEWFTNSRDDQSNVIAQASLATLNPSIIPQWKSADEYICTDFTLEQIIQLATDGATFKTERIKTFETLKQQIIECGTIESVEEVEWVNYVW